MKVYPTIFLLSLALSAFSQTSKSPDGKFSFTRSSKDLGDHILWKCSLVDITTSDTLLIANNFTHDEPPPIAGWNTTGSRLVFHERDTIKVFNLLTRKTIYSEHGLIWNNTENFFDPENSTLFFLRSSGLNHENFQLFSLNIETLKNRVIKSFITSGDSLTGIPVILKADFNKRELVIEIESKDLKTEKFTVKY